MKAGRFSQWCRIAGFRQRKVGQGQARELEWMDLDCKSWGREGHTGWAARCQEQVWMDKERMNQASKSNNVVPPPLLPLLPAWGASDEKQAPPASA